MDKTMVSGGGQNHLSVTVPEPAGTVTLNFITKYVW